MLERDVEKHFIRRVEQAHGVTYKLKFLGVRGAPDRMAILPHGRIFLVELKAPGKEATKLQQWLHKKLAGLGVHVPVLCNKWEVDQWFAVVTNSAPIS